MARHRASHACFLRIFVECRDLFRAHAFGRQPLRNVDVAQSFDVGEHLGGAGSGGRAGGREGVADQHDSRLDMALADAEISRPNPDSAGHPERAHDLLDAGHHGAHRLLGGLHECHQPRVGHVAVDHEVDAHRAADRKYREVGHARTRPLRPVGQGREIECRAADRLDVEAQRDRVACADDLALDAQRPAQADIQAVGEDHQPRRDFLAVRQHEFLPFRAAGDPGSLGVDRLEIFGDLRPHGVDQRVVHHAVLVARLPGDDMAEARFPDFAVERGRAQGGVGKAGLVQQVELFAAELFAAQLRRIDGMRIDQDRRETVAPQHRGCGRPGETAADDCNIRVAHALPLDRGLINAPEKANKS